MWKTWGYRGFILSILKCPDFVFRLVFFFIYPVYAFLHRNSACKRVKFHLTQTGFADKVSVRDVFYSLFFNALDSVRYLTREKKMLARVHYENEYIIQEAIAGGLPVVGMSIHQGAFEMLHRCLCRYSSQVHLFTEPFPDQTLTETLRELRADPHLKEHRTSEISTLLRKFLREKSILALVTDQAKNAKGNTVTLFEKKTDLYLRLPLEANRLGAAVVTFRTFRNADGNHTIRFERCYAPRTNPEELIESFTHDAETWISEHPEQWAWNYHGLFAV